MDKSRTDKTDRKAKPPPRHTTYFLTANCPKSHSTTTVTKVSHSPQESHIALKPSMSCESVDSFFFSDISVIDKEDAMEGTPEAEHEPRKIIRHTALSEVRPLALPLALSATSSKPASLLSIDSAVSSPRLDASEAFLSETLLSSDDDSDMGGGRMPQFIMPTIALPSRRPFTETGLRLGKLRVLVAGQYQSGKSALIRSLVQQCGDIVYVDAAVPIVTPQPRSKAARTYHEPVMWETQASTRPSPVFAHPIISDSSTLTATAEDNSALDFNLSFVECSHSVDWLDHATAYLEHQLQQTSEMVNPTSPNCAKIMMTSAGLENVDVCLFLLCQPPTMEDIEQMRLLSSYVPLVPLVSKSDIISDKQAAALKISILRTLERNAIVPFSFDYSVADILSATEESDVLSSDEDDGPKHPPVTPLIRRSTTPHYPFAVSSVAELELDASILMQSNYTPRLVQSNLGLLCGHLFSEKGASWLRYKAGQQFISWAVRMQQSVTLRGIRSADIQPVTNFYVPDYLLVPPISLDQNLLANRSTVDWISQLKTESGVLVQVTKARGPVYNCLDGKSRHDLDFCSHSISNIDPLELKLRIKFINKIIHWACNALSYTVGATLLVKVVTACVQGNLYAPPPPPLIVVAKETPLNDAALALYRILQSLSRELIAATEFTF